MKTSYQSARQKVAGISSGHHNPNTIADHTETDQLKRKTNKLAYLKIKPNELCPIRKL